MYWALNLSRRKGESVTQAPWVCVTCVPRCTLGVQELRRKVEMYFLPQTCNLVRGIGLHEGVVY